MVTGDMEHLVMTALTIALVGIAGGVFIGGMGTTFGMAGTEDIGFLNATAEMAAQINQTQSTLASGEPATGVEGVAIGVEKAWVGLVGFGELIPSTIGVYTSLITNTLDIFRIPFAGEITFILIAMVSVTVIFAIYYAIFKVKP